MASWQSGILKPAAALSSYKKTFCSRLVFLLCVSACPQSPPQSPPLQYLCANSPAVNLGRVLLRTMVMAERGHADLLASAHFSFNLCNCVTLSSVVLVRGILCLL